MSSAIEYMNLAIEQMQRSSGSGPLVGAVVVSDNKVLAVGHKQPGIHAERMAIETAIAEGKNLEGATLYTTLEPCVSVESHKEPCADLIARVGIRAVYIGRYDPNPHIYRSGWRLLRDAGLSLHDFAADQRNKIDVINARFTEWFVTGVGPRGGAKVDYQLNEGRFEIRFSETDNRSIVTQWTRRGADSIYAYAMRPVRVALARYAVEFLEVDDPSALDFTYTVPVSVGEIAVFMSATGAVLVKLLEVFDGGGTTGAAQRWIKINYEVRC